MKVYSLLEYISNIWWYIILLKNSVENDVARLWKHQNHWDYQHTGWFWNLNTQHSATNQGDGLPVLHKPCESAMSVCGALAVLAFISFSFNQLNRPHLQTHPTLSICQPSSNSWLCHTIITGHVRLWFTVLNADNHQWQYMIIIILGNTILLWYILFLVYGHTSAWCQPPVLCVAVQTVRVHCFTAHGIEQLRIFMPITYYYWRFSFIFLSNVCIYCDMIRVTFLVILLVSVQVFL